jgi:hypothetical protein
MDFIILFFLFVILVINYQFFPKNNVKYVIIHFIYHVINAIIIRYIYDLAVISKII